MPAGKLNTSVEQYTISMVPVNDGIDVIFEWADVRFMAPVKGE